MFCFVSLSFIFSVLVWVFFFFFFFFWNDLEWGIHALIFLSISYFLWILNALSDYWVSILWHCFKVIPFPRTSSHPSSTELWPHCWFWHTSTFYGLRRTLGSWGIGGDCGFETNLCSFTMNQKKPHFFQRFGFFLNSSTRLHIFSYNHFLAKAKTGSWKILLF